MGTGFLERYVMTIYVVFADFGCDGYEDPVYAGTDEIKAMAAMKARAAELSYGKMVMQIWRDNKCDSSRVWTKEQAAEA